MKLVKFRIKNYKSIIDSNDCYFSENLTIFAGKNESGKTSILEALEDFHEENVIREDAKPINSMGLPEIAITFDLKAKEVVEIFKEIDLQSKVDSVIRITLIKKYGNKFYNLDDESRNNLLMPSIYQETITIINSFIKNTELFVKDIPDFDGVPQVVQGEELSGYKNEIESYRKKIDASKIISEEIKENIEKEILKILEKISEYYQNDEYVRSFVDSFIKKKLPYFILFSSFEDEFPKTINLASLEKDEWAKDLEEVSTFKIEKIKSSNDQERRNHQQKVNTEFTEKFKKFWSQDRIKLQIEKEGEKINFWIEENGMQYYPSQRSKGQQWYLSFYIRMVARIKEDKPNIILIDEPGLYLHAKAQKDVLKILKQHGSTNPIVFSTHSPYLIEEDNLECVRLVEKNENGTKILGKIHAHVSANKDTLTPVLTAIGLGVNDSITNIDQKDNIVVEGPSDVFYLQAFKILFSEDFKTNFINGGGASNMGVVGSVLEGWGANVYYLFDNDKGKDDGIKKINQWAVLPMLIKSVLDQKEGRIEDVLTSTDFKNLVLKNPKAKYTCSNSEYVKKKKLDKVLIARMFLQKVKSEKISLEDVSMSNIKGLFKKLNFNYE